jgi:hypothetical protein
MFSRLRIGWVAGALMALALGVTLVTAAHAASTKEKTVHFTGIVKAVTPTSISLEERHLLRPSVKTYMRSASPAVQTSKGTGMASMADVQVGAKVELIGTQGPDGKVMINTIRLLEAPLGKGQKR